MAVGASNGIMSKATVDTHDSPHKRRDALKRVVNQAASIGRELEIRYEPRLHHREIVLSTGIVIMSDRSLDLYEAPTIGLRRQAQGRAARVCHGGLVGVFSRGPGSNRFKDIPRTAKTRHSPFNLA